MKQRLDLLLVDRGLADTRSQAQAMIMAGHISSGGRRLDKPGVLIEVLTDLHVKDQPRYVSRAGDKLASVAHALGLDFRGKVVLDVGSSTGGFTDFALQNGAVKAYCVDVGTAQLAYKLRQDDRIVVMERTDIRDAQLPELADMAVMDVSFISLTKVLEPTAALVKPGALIVAMAKPQFEAGKAIATRFHGVIADEKVRNDILSGFEDAIRAHFEILDSQDSGVPGAEGNVERFYLLRSMADSR